MAGVESAEVVSYVKQNGPPATHQTWDLEGFRHGPRVVKEPRVG